jgi:hypothetical protein
MVKTHFAYIFRLQAPLFLRVPPLKVIWIDMWPSASSKGCALASHPEILGHVVPFHRTVPPIFMLGLWSYPWSYGGGCTLIRGPYPILPRRLNPPALLVIWGGYMSYNKPWAGAYPQPFPPPIKLCIQLK